MRFREIRELTRHGQTRQVEVIKVKHEDGTVEVCPRGGGFVMTVPHASLGRRIDPDVVKLERQFVTMDYWENTKVEAYVDLNDRWNGWMIPWFTKENAYRVIEILEHDGFSDTGEIYFDRDGTVVWTMESADGEWDYAPPVRRQTEDGWQTLYSIGGMSWCWEIARESTDVEPEEVA